MSNDNYVASTSYPETAGITRSSRAIIRSASHPSHHSDKQSEQSPSMPSSPPQPLFHRRRRRNPTKRRRPPPSPPSSPSPTHHPRIRRPANPPPSSRFHSSTRSKPSLQPPPFIPGYDDDTHKDPSTNSTSSPSAPISKSPHRADYSTDGLRKLRLENTRQEALSRQRWGQVPPSNFVSRPEGSGNVMPSQKDDLRDSYTGGNLVADRGNVDDGLVMRNGAEAKKDVMGMRDTVGKADPFSEAWTEGLHGRMSGDRDGDVVVVDDYVGVAGADTMDAEDPRESDAEWEKELLRRAGQGQDGLDKEMGRRVRRVLVNVDGIMRRNGKKELELGLKAVREAMEGWRKREELGREKLLRLEEVVAREKTERVIVDGDLAMATEKARFYSNLKEYLEDVSDMLKEKRGVIEDKRDRMLETLEEETRNVRKRLEGGVDEFGRIREASLEWEEVENKDGEGSSPFSDVREEVSGIGKLQEIFGEWKQSYEPDYKKAFADASLGKLAGRLILGSGPVHFEEVKDLNEIQRREMWKAADGNKTVASMIRARWRPRVIDSCEEYGWLAKELVKADPSGGDKVVEALDERLGWEVNACVKLGQPKAVVQCLKGAVALTKIVGRDIGLERVMGAIEKLGVEQTDLEEVREELSWIASSQFKVEGIRTTRRLCEKAGINWTFAADSDCRSNRISLPSTP